MKNLTKEKGYIIAGIVSLIVILVALLVFNNVLDETEQESVEVIESKREILKTVEATTKINDFVLNKIPNDEVFLKFHLDGEGEHNLTVEEKKAAALEMFYAAVDDEDINYFTSAVTPETFQSVWGNEMDFGKREEILYSFLSELNGNGTLAGMTYSMELGQFDTETDSGTLFLEYENDSILEIPFSFVVSGEGDELMYQLEVHEFQEALDK